MPPIRIWYADSILFDLDGVLVDSMAVVDRLLSRWAALHGLDTQQVLRLARGRRERELIAQLAPALDVDVEVERMRTWQVSEFAGCRTCPGALRLISALRPDTWAVVTSGSREVAAGRLAAAGFALPRVLVAADDVQLGKPDPSPYLLAADRLGRRPERCIVVEDAPSGVTAGKRAGMRVVGVVSDGAPTFIGADLHVGSLTQIRAADAASDEGQLRIEFESTGGGDG